MKSSTQIIAFAIALAVPSLAVVVHQEVVIEEKIVYVTRTGDPPKHTVNPSSTGLSAESAEGATLSEATLPASAVTPASSQSIHIHSPSTTIPATSAPGGAIVSPTAQAGDGVMRIIIQNHWPEPLSLDFGDNEGSPGALGSPTAGPLGTETTIVYPTGWAGRINIGKTVHSADSKIEGSTTGANDIDVSYVDGYSVPISCSNHVEVLSGCNIDLYTTGNCTNMVGDKEVCLNPTQDIADGPATDFFLPCQGAAYTFPNDNIANNGNTKSVDHWCCIGTEAMGCKGPERQGKGNNKPSKAKRSLSKPEQALAFNEAVAHKDTNANGHSHVARHLKRAKARHQNHGLALGLKNSI